MTICIAAIAANSEGKEVIVFATDHMVSITSLGQFEKDTPKYKEVNTNTIAMLSGNPLIFDALLDGCSSRKKFGEIGKTIHENICKAKDDQLKKGILDMCKIDFDYIKDILREEVKNKYIDGILQAVTSHSLNVGILLIGFENNTAQMTEISELGIDDMRDLHFDCIGSGAVQAMNTLLFQKHSKSDSIAIGVYNVYKAKRNAEVSVGVGKETEIAILTEEGISEIDAEQMEVLREIYEEELEFGKSHTKLNELIRPK